MRFLLVALFLLAAAAEKPAPAQKGAPSQPKKRRTTPTPHPPAGPTRAEKTKTAMA
jgi:hypothetical protein